MIRLDLLFFGYFKYFVGQEDVARCSAIFLKQGINAKFEDCSFLIKKKDANRIDSLLSGRIKYQKSELLGMYGFVYKNRKRYGAMLGILLSAFLIFFFSDVVWDVRIEGCLTGNEEEIARELSEVGFSVGDRWSKIDKNEVEVSLLKNSELVSWVNVNRRGTVAYVSVIDKYLGKDEKKTGYSNLVAERDGIIEEITVKEGFAVVKAGDTVKKGDVLISGILPSELGGGFCYATGTVIARVSESITVFSQKKVVEKVYEEEQKHAFSIKFFGKNINIFKSYRNFDKEYDIIENNKDLILCNTRIPFSLVSEIKRFYTLSERTLSESELKEKAEILLEKEIAKRLMASAPNEIITEGNLTDGGYTLKAFVVYSTDIGRDLGFSTFS
jgi:similar to stage IV sporulation protein